MSRQVARARAFLQEILASGPVPSCEVGKAAGARGIKPRTLERAKGAMGVQARKAGFRSGWIWVLSPKGASAGEDSQAKKDGTPKAAMVVAPGNGDGRATRTFASLSDVWKDPLVLAAVEDYWRAIALDVPAALFWMEATMAEAEHPGDLISQAEHCAQGVVSKLSSEKRMGDEQET